MWIRVESLQGGPEYVNLDKVVKVFFRVNLETKKYGEAILYAAGGQDLIILGKVTGDISLQNLEEYVTTGRIGTEFVGG
jgi:hypothetical protein